MYAPLPANDEGVVSHKGSALLSARSRLIFIGFLLSLCFFAVAARVTYLTLFYQASLTKTVSGAALEAQSETAETLAKGRADIVDRNGVLLATMVDAISLYADPKDIQNPKSLAQKLANILPDQNAKTLQKKLSGKGRFIWLKRGVTPDEIDAINALGEPGLNFRHEPRRFYPQAHLTAHVVGYISSDGDPQTGIERGQNKHIKSAGEALKLSLDVRLQHVVRRHLTAQIQKFSAKSGMGLVMDARTGEILAAVSLPDFDPNHPGDENPDTLRNRFASDVNEMGSTFKLFTAAAQLELVKNSFNQWFDASHKLKRGRFTISDYHPQNRVLSLPEVIAYSSNIGSALIGEKLGQKYVAFLTKLGLLTPLSTELYETTKPLLPKRWGQLEVMTATYGHGFAVGTLHLAKGVAMLINGGMPVTPTFMAAKKPTAEKAPPVINTKTSENVRKLMRLVVTVGSGSKADVKGFMVGGKTGTSEKNIRGGYSENKSFTTFVGAFPMNDPRYVIIASVDEPRGIKETGGYATAGYVAAPVIAHVVEDMADLLALKPVADEADTAFYTTVKPYLKGEISMSNSNDH